MLMNMWYVAEDAVNVKDTPIKVKICRQELVLYRDGNGKIVCSSDICPHKGASLAEGVVRDGNIACPYHGWQFGDKGTCLKIPSVSDDAKIPKRARIDSYPVEEKFGWVWVFLGDLPAEERPPLPDFPEYDEIGTTFGEVRGEWHWNANYERVLENGLDFGHAPFVHPAFGDPDNAEINPVSVTEHEWGATASHIYKPPAPKGLWKSLRKKPGKGVKASPGFHVSGSTLRLEVCITSNWRMIILDVNTPVDENTTHTRWIMLRNFFTSKIWDFDGRRRTESIFEQDTKIVERIRPEQVPDKLAEEMSVQSDALMMAARAQFKALKKRGWEIDLDALDRDYTGKRASVIPSPARREDPKGWIIPAVPLVSVD